MRFVFASASLAIADATAAAALPSQMMAVQASGTPCDAPDWSCITENEVGVPKPGFGQALIEVRGSSVNPVNIDLVIPECKHMPAPFGCMTGTIGNDGAGVVVSTGPFCHGLKIGDEVYGQLKGAYAQYSLVSCSGVALKPKNLSFVDAGVLPVVAGTSYSCLHALGLPSRQANLTVVITSGQGGTGAMGIQLAKAMGATTVITSASGDGIEYVKKLGADIVVDYHKQDLFDDYLADDSVDLVYDNFGVQGTADRAMHAIRSGGKFLVLLGGNGGTISKNPKKGVDQIAFTFATQNTLPEVAELYDAGKLQPITWATYGLHDVKQSWTDKEAGRFFGKLAVVPSNSTSTATLV